MAKTGLILAGGGAAAATAAVVIYVVANGQAPAPAATDPLPAVAVAPEQAPSSENQTVVEPLAEVDPDASPEGVTVDPPSFDVVRVEPSGQTLIAGRGQADNPVAIRLDGEALMEAQTDSAGKFAQFLDIPPSDKPRVLTLSMRVDGEDVESDASVIIAPAVTQTADVEDAPATDAAEAAIVDDVAENTPAEEDAAPVVADAADASEDAAIETAADTLADAPTGVVTDVAGEMATASLEEPARDEASEEDIAADTAADEPAAASDTTAAKTEPTSEPDTADLAQSEDAPATTPVTTAAETTLPETLPETNAEAAPKVSDAEPQSTEEGEATEVADAEPQSTEEGEATEVAQAEPAAPTVLSVEQEGLRVLQGPEVTDTIALDTISYDAAGEVELAGRGAEGFVRVYLDNTPVTTSRIEADGSWAVDLPDVDRGIYTLRVDEVSDTGDVTSRVETPFKREDRDALAASDTGEATPARVLTVQPGNTLWAIARERYGEGTLYVRLFEANKDRIRDPNLIYPGQVFDLPN